ncbi:unnamed protein product, partial [Iphiclides podalirius]
MRLLILALVSMCGATDYQYSAVNKKNDVEYGERLSSLENVRMPSNKSKLLHRSTRCTTGKPITMDPNYIPSSDEEDRKKSENSKDAKDDIATEVSGTATKKLYKAPPTVKNPDHYIDDD